MEALTWALMWTSVILGSLGVIYLYFSYKFTYWKKRGVPHKTPYFPVGNTPDLVFSRKTLGEQYADIYNENEGNRFVGVYLLQTPNLLLRDPDLIEKFLVKDFEHFHDHGFTFDEKVDPMGANLYQLSGARWKELRVKMEPAFTSDKMKMMIQNLVDCGLELEKCLKQPAEREDILDVKELMSRYATDVIATCAFGIKCNCLMNPDTEFRRWGRKVFEPSINLKFRHLLYLVSPWLAIWLNISSFPRDAARFFTSVVEKTISYRDTFNIKRNDFMQLLIRLKNNGTVDDEDRDKHTEGETTLSNIEVVAQAFVFIVAGFETTSTTLSFCLYELALHTGVQERLRKEIDAVLEKHGGNITYEALKEMIYLDKVISETLRKHPPIPFLLRECTKEYRIPDTEVIIEKGTQVLVPIFGLHYDPKYFPDPKKFDPERFSEEAKIKRHHYAYLPFGEGPRICIGIEFSILQVKVGLVSVLQNYQFRVCNRTCIPLKYDTNTTILFLEGGNWLQIRKRAKVIN